MHYPDQQCHLLAMPKTASLRELKRRKGESHVLPQRAQSSRQGHLATACLKRLGQGQDNLAGCLCLVPWGFQVLNQHVASLCMNAEGRARCPGP